MYTFDSEKNIYVFKNDLREYLMKHGVNDEHIEKMQKKKLERSRDEYQDFPDVHEVQRDYVTLVPLEKVIGTSRCTVGDSVFENVRKMKKGEREPFRFIDCFKYLEKMSLKELYQSYENLYNPVRMVCYVDDDNYYVSGDGNHRTLVAMLVGAKYIRAIVTSGRCNEYKKKKYLYSQEFIRRYNIIRIMSSQSKFDISFCDDNGVYEVCGYPVPAKNEDVFSFLERLSNILDEDMKKADYYRKMPTAIRRIVLQFEANNRIEQYMVKKYLTDDQLNIWNNRMPIALFNI